MGSGGGNSTTTTKSNSGLPGWEQEPAKAYLSSLMGLVFPGMTVPKGWFPGGKSGWSFPTNGPSAAANGGTGAPAAAAATSGVGSSGVPPQGGAVGGTSGQPSLNQFASNNFLDPMIASSPYLQGLMAMNPAGVQGAMSPAASNQLAMLYPNLANQQGG